MKSLMFLSTEPFSGKTGLAINLVLELRARGAVAGYFKPVGNLPTSVDSIIADQDALFAVQSLKLADRLEQICPLILTSTETKERLRGKREPALAAIIAARDEVAAGKDSLIVEGSGHMNDGRLYGASAAELVDALDTRAVLVVKLDNAFEIVDDVLVVKDRLGARLAGVIFNWVHHNQLDTIKDIIVPFLADEGIESFGIIPREERLMAVSVDSLTKALGGRVLCAQGHGSDMIETFMVGAMGQEQALRFFRRKSKKAVITGGDRADVQLAALETPTTCLVLTGNYMPPAAVLAVAESKGVPMILVDVDTLTAVERTESLIGQMRVHDEAKLREMRARMEEFLNIDALCRAAM